MRMDEAPVWHRSLELRAQLADVHVDRAVSGPRLASPDGAEELLAPDDRSEPPYQRNQQLELPARTASAPVRRPAPARRRAQGLCIGAAGAAAEQYARTDEPARPGRGYRSAVPDRRGRSQRA